MRGAEAWIEGGLMKHEAQPKDVGSKTSAAAEAFGFVQRWKGSHRVYVRQGVTEILNFQNVGRQNPHQVLQRLK